MMSRGKGLHQRALGWAGCRAFRAHIKSMGGHRTYLALHLTDSVLSCLSDSIHAVIQVMMDAASQAHLPSVTDLCIHAGVDSLKATAFTGLQAQELAWVLLEGYELQENEVGDTRASWPIGASELHAPAC